MGNIHVDISCPRIDTATATQPVQLGEIMHITTRFVAVAVTSMLLSACAGLPMRPLVAPGAEPILPYVPTVAGRETSTAMSTAMIGELIGAGECTDKLTVSQCLAKALRYANRSENSAEQGVLLRNRIQDYLISASNEQCRIYSANLRVAAAEPNFWLGTLTTLFGAAGAATTVVQSARTLAALAAGTSGIRAEFNQDFFASQTADVIIGAFNSARKEKLAAMNSARGDKGNKPLLEYTIERAVADAIQYHGDCSIAAGLTHANKALTSYDDIGLNRFHSLNADLLSKPNASNNFGTGALLRDFATWYVQSENMIADAEGSLNKAEAGAAVRFAEKKTGNTKPDCTKDPDKPLDPCKTVLAAGEKIRAAKGRLFLNKDGTIDRTQRNATLETALVAKANAEKAWQLGTDTATRPVKAAELEEASATLRRLQAQTDAELDSDLKAVKTLTTALDAWKPQ